MSAHMSSDPTATPRRPAFFSVVSAVGLLLFILVDAQQMRCGPPPGQRLRGSVWDFLLAAALLLMGAGTLGSATGRWGRLLGAVIVAYAVLTAVRTIWR